MSLGLWTNSTITPSGQPRTICSRRDMSACLTSFNSLWLSTQTRRLKFGCAFQYPADVASDPALARPLLAPRLVAACGLNEFTAIELAHAAQPLEGLAGSQYLTSDGMLPVSAAR